MKRSVFLLTAVCLALPAQDIWQIDTAHSAAQFAVRHMMVSTVRGHFGKIRGTAKFDMADPTKGSVEAEVDVTSIDTREPKRDAHLRNADFFDAEKHPKMNFVSKRIEPAGHGKLKMTGDLTIRGVTKPVVFDVEGPSNPISDPRGGQRIGAQATAKINRQDFGVNWNRALDAGGLAVGNEVTITIDLEMTKR